MPSPCRIPCRALCLLLLLTMTACNPANKKEASNKPKGIPPALVLTAPVQRQDVPVEIETFGTMEASESVTVKPMVSGELTKVAFREGQDVTAGDLLFELDPRPYQAALHKASASLARNRVIMENARRDYERYSKLVQEGIVTQEQSEGYRTKAETAAADLAADQAAVENAQVQLSYCTIQAPISGRLGTLAVDRGNVVKANDITLVTINTLSPINATFTIPEKSLTLVKERLTHGDMALKAVVPEAAGLAEQGQVTFIDNAVDTSTGSIRLKGSFRNEQKHLWPGQFVTLSITLEVKPQALVVPTQAIQTGQKGPFVFVVKEDASAEVRPVTPGAVYQGLTVIDKGLQADEQVVIDGQMRVIPGGKVEIKTANKAGAAKGEGAGPAKTDAPGAPGR